MKLFKRSIEAILAIGVIVLLVWNSARLYGKYHAGAFDGRIKRGLPSGKVVVAGSKSTEEGNVVAKAKNSYNLCRRSGDTDDVRLVILAIGGPTLFKERQNWRNSSEIRLNSRTRVLFIMLQPSDGATVKQVADEDKKYSDLLILRVPNGAEMMTDSLQWVAGIRWVRDFCPQTGHVLRADIHTIVMVTTLLEYIDNLPPDEKMNLYTGTTVHRGAWAQRSGEYAVTIEEWPLSSYPDYVGYNSVILSGDAAALMAQASTNVTLFRFADVYFGLLAKAARPPILPKAAQFRTLARLDVKDELTNYCKMRPYVLILSSSTDDVMQKGWTTLKERTDLECRP